MMEERSEYPAPPSQEDVDWLQARGIRSIADMRARLTDAERERDEARAKFDEWAMRDAGPHTRRGRHESQT